MKLVSLSLVPAIALLCALEMILASDSDSRLHLVPRSLGTKAIYMNTFEGNIRALEETYRRKTGNKYQTSVIRDFSTIGGCEWLRFIELFNLIERREYPERDMITVALAKQLKACEYKATNLPGGDGLDAEELNKLRLFSERAKDVDFHGKDSLKKMVKACLAFLSKDLQVTHAQIKKETEQKQERFTTFLFGQMDFCFKIESKLHSYFEFVDHVGGPESKKLENNPVIAERAKLGFICRVFVINQQEIAELAFRETFALWPSLKKGIKELVVCGADNKCA